MGNDDWHEVIEGLRDNDPALAAQAAEWLHKESHAEDVERLRNLLDDKEPFVREAAAWPLTEILGANSLGELLVAYQRGFEDGDDNDGFSAALIELAARDPIGCRHALVTLLDCTDETTRTNALWLSEFCNPIH